MERTLHPILATAIAERSSEGLRIYADHLEEQGDPEAAGWRLLGETGNWPEHQLGYDKRPDEFWWYASMRGMSLPLFVWSGLKSLRHTTLEGALRDAVQSFVNRGKLGATKSLTEFMEQQEPIKDGVPVP